MPAAGAQDARRGRLGQGLFWGGVSLAPVAILILLFGQGTGSLRIAVTLAVLTIVSLAVSIAMRPSVEMVRVDIEHRVLDEMERVRMRTREEISMAARNTHRALTDRIHVITASVEDLRAQVDEVQTGAMLAPTSPVDHQGPPGMVRRTETVHVTRRTTTMAGDGDPSSTGTVYGSKTAVEGEWRERGDHRRDESRDDRAPDDRHRDDRHGEDRHRDDRQGEDRHRDDRHGEDRHRDDRQGEDRHRDDRHGDDRDRDRHVDDRYRDDRGRDDRGRDDRGRDDRGRDDRGRDDPYRDDRVREDRYRDDRVREDRYRDDRERDDRSGDDRYPIGPVGRYGDDQYADNRYPDSRERYQDRRGEDRWEGMSSGDRWASVRDDDHGRELRMGERRSSVRSDGRGTEFRVEDRWAALRRDEPAERPHGDSEWDSSFRSLSRPGPVRALPPAPGDSPGRYTDDRYEGDRDGVRWRGRERMAQDWEREPDDGRYAPRPRSGHSSEYDR